MKTTPLPVPWGMSREMQGTHLVISRYWRKVDKVWGIIAVTVLWNAMMIGWYQTREIDWFEGSGGQTFFASQPGRLVILAFAGFGLFLIYVSLTTLVNTTRVEVAPALLSVTTGPLPWHRERRLMPAEVSNVIYREKGNEGYATVYRVLAVLANGEEGLLVAGLVDYEVTVFYVREIRAALGLPDVALSPDA